MQIFKSFKEMIAFAKEANGSFSFAYSEDEKYTFNKQGNYITSPNEWFRW